MNAPWSGLVVRLVTAKRGKEQNQGVGRRERIEVERMTLLRRGWNDCSEKQRRLIKTAGPSHDGNSTALSDDTRCVGSVDGAVSKLRG